MEESVFRENFPAFPAGPDYIQKFGVLLRGKKLLSKEDWDELRKTHEDNEALLSAISQRADIFPKALADIEATLLDVPFIDLEAVQIPHEVLKLFKIPQMVEHRVIPIKLTGQELLVGTIAPADTEALARIGANATLALRPAKVLWEQLEKRLAKLTESKSAPRPAAKKGPRKRLGDILVENKFVTDEQMSEALEGAKKEKQRLGAYLVKKNLLSNKQLSIALSKQFDIPYIDLDESLVDPVLATLLPKKLCYDQIMCPVKREDNKLVLAMTDPTDIITIDHVEMMTGMRISPVVSSELSIMSSLGKLYGESMDALADQVGNSGQPEAGDEDLGNLSENDAPIIKLVNLILTQAVQTNVSDIHIEVFEKELRIRFRKDGVMRLHMTPTRSAHAGVASRIKVMANLDIAETRMPQDGRIKLALQNRKVDLRVSTVPCVWGEKIVMRLLDQGNLKVNLTDLGFEPHVLETYMGGVKQPNGIILVTGPTGSGKTTTLYSSLHLLNNPAVNIMTAEDPVEYNLMGINQVQCHADIGLTFSAALRSFLRQDPDIIMLGEIRDYETASIAIKAAMTGHLVISTLHTNDAPSTVARLLNMGIEPFSLSSSLRVVEAQRLVRKICKSCATPYKPNEDLLKSLGINQQLLRRLHLSDLDLATLNLTKGAGCPDCDHTGLKGRQGIYEVLSITQAVRELIEAKANTEDMRRQALRDGMLSLRESALYKLLTGKTSVEEVFRTTMDAGGEEDSEATGGAGTTRATGHPGPKGSAGSRTPGAGAIAIDVPIEGISTLAGEIHAFRTTLSRLAGDALAQAQIDGEILRQQITSPLQQLKTQIQAGLTGGDTAKILPLLQAQEQKMEFNLHNIVHHFSPPALNPGKATLNQLVEKEMIGELKSHVITARLLAGNTAIGQGLKVTKNLFSGLPAVMVDLEAFRIIVANLMVNALITLKPGGEIKILTRLKPNAPDRAELIVFDNGTGISPEVQDQLFTPFQPHGRKTLGLGLAVVKKLMVAGKGSVSVKSQPGTNTLVTLEFPVAGE
jgi:type IV pilus assembly protein PilB